MLNKQQVSQQQTHQLHQTHNLEFLHSFRYSLENIIQSLREEQVQINKQHHQQIEKYNSIIQQKDAEICTLKREIERKKQQEINKDMHPVPHKVLMKSNKSNNEIMVKKYKKCKNVFPVEAAKQAKCFNAFEMKENRFSLQIGSLINSQNINQKKSMRSSSSNIKYKIIHQDKTSPTPLIKRKSEAFLSAFDNTGCYLMQLNNMSQSVGVSPRCKTGRLINENNNLILQESQKQQYESQKKPGKSFSNKVKFNKKPYESKKTEVKNQKSKIEMKKQKCGTTIPVKIISVSGLKPR